jgi:uncharacterized protein (DUF1778 family)
MTQYLASTRATTISARITVADRRLIEAAAAKRRAPSLSAYVAEVATKAAQLDLFKDDPTSTLGNPVDRRAKDRSAE